MKVSRYEQYLNGIGSIQVELKSTNTQAVLNGQPFTSDLLFSIANISVF
jgi:hypothetical protein